MPANDDQEDSLAKQGLGAASVVAKIAKHLKIIPGAAIVDDVLSSLWQRRIDRQVGRLRKVVGLLADQVCGPEDLTDEQVDLFEEILASAVDEEDETKLPYYVTCVQLHLDEKWEAPLVRMVAGALRQLSKPELDAFADFASGSGHSNLGKGLPDVYKASLRLRLASLSLMTPTGVLMAGTANLTPVGIMVAQVVERAAG